MENVLGEYCFDQDANDNIGQWVLLKYKGDTEPLFSYSKCSYFWKYSLLPDYDYFFIGPSMMAGNLEFVESKPARCIGNFSKEMVNMSFEKIPWFSENQDFKTDSIFGHYFKMQWSVSYDSSYVRLNTSGTVKIYILGFCTEEQLKMIQERKK